VDGSVELFGGEEAGAKRLGHLRSTFLRGLQSRAGLKESICRVFYSSAAQVGVQNPAGYTVLKVCKIFLRQTLAGTSSI
jgi:hypothetical protein